MEPLWSPVVATGGNRSQIARALKPPKHAKTVAVGCDRLPRAAHGKEGVDGSGLARALGSRRTNSRRNRSAGRWVHAYRRRSSCEGVRGLHLEDFAARTPGQDRAHFGTAAKMVAPAAFSKYRSISTGTGALVRARWPKRRPRIRRQTMCPL